MTKPLFTYTICHVATRGCSSVATVALATAIPSYGMGAAAREAKCNEAINRTYTNLLEGL